MNTWKRFAVAAALATLTGAALATGNAVTKQSVEKSALSVHPGTVEMAQKMQKNGKDIWEVKVKGTDGKQYVVNFDAKTGKELK